MNLDEIERIWHFCRQRNIFPSLEVLTPTGQGQAEYLPDQGITTEEIRNYKLEAARHRQEHLRFRLAALHSSRRQRLSAAFIQPLHNDRGQRAAVRSHQVRRAPGAQTDGVYPHNVRTRPLQGHLRRPAVPICPADRPPSRRQMRRLRTSERVHRVQRATHTRSGSTRAKTHIPP